MTMSTLALSLPWSSDIDKKLLPPPPVVCRRGHLPCSVPESQPTSHVVAMSHKYQETRLLSGPFTVPVTRDGRTSGLLPERGCRPRSPELILRNSPPQGYYERPTCLHVYNTAKTTLRTDGEHVSNAF